MKRWGMMILVLGLAVMAWGKEKASQPPSWERPRSAKDFSAEMASSQAFSETHQIRQPLGSYGVTTDPYVGWVSTYPSYYSTSLGPGGTQGNFAASDTPDTAHWFRYWLGPYERIDWHINSSNPGYTKYNAYLYQSVDGQPGALLTEAAGADNPDSIVFQNSSAGTYVFLRFTLLRGNAYDDYTLWGIGAGTQTSPVYLSSFSLNGALQDRDEIMDGVAARMIPGRYDDWYYWYWPDTIAGQPVEAIKLVLAFDSTRINLDLYARSNEDPLQTPYFETSLAWTDGPHYSTGTNWVTKETGWIHRPNQDNPGLWLDVHTTNDYGYSQVYRINNALAMTSSGAEVAYPVSTMDGDYYYAYPGGDFLNSGLESPVFYYHRPHRQERPQPAPPPVYKMPLQGVIKAVARGPRIPKPVPVIRPQVRPVLTPVIRPPQPIQVPVQVPVQSLPVRPQPTVDTNPPPSSQPSPPRVAPAETPGVSAGGGKSS